MRAVLRAAVGEASEASRDADVTVAHAHAQRHGCLSARCAQTCAPRAEGHDTPQIDEPKVEKRTTTLKPGFPSEVPDFSQR